MAYLDKELCRKLLVLVGDNGHCIASGLEIEGYDSETIQKHARLLHSGGFIEATVDRVATREHPNDSILKRLTYSGAEFLDAALNDSVWQRTKTRLGSLFTTVSLAVLAEQMKESINSMIKGT